MSSKTNYMKKLILSTLLLGAAFASKAQITISNSCFPKVGDRVIMHNDTLLSSAITAGTAGANQTWNLTSIQDGFQDTTTAITLSTAPLASSYPTATIAMAQGGGTYGFVKATATNLDLVGYSGDLLGTGSPMAIKLNPAQSLAKVGTTFGSNYTNTSGFVITVPGSAVGQTSFDSIRMNFKQRMYNNFDAWGTVTTQAGTFNCLRNNQLIVTTQVIDVKLPFVGWMNGAQADSSASGTYLFVDNTAAMEVAAIDVDSFGTVIGARYRDVSSVNSVADVKSSSVNMSIFPVPANSISVILTNGLAAGNYTGSIYNLNGQLMHEVTLLASNGLVVMNLNNCNLTSGMYVASVRNAAGELVASRKFQFVK